jgi:DNA uptake protein ComE-like DNA-binding protein
LEGEMERNKHSGVKIPILVGKRNWMLALGICVAVMAAVGCNGSGPSPQQVQQDAAKTTADAKKGAEQAVAATRQAAAVAVQDVNAAASGVKSGIDENAPAGSSLKSDLKANLNTSTQVRLAMLPGISMDKAGEIVEKRPYANSHQLVSRGLLTEDEYQKIASDITTR